MSDSALEVLMAERDIRRAATNYCRGVDRLDRELLASAWHRDATCEYEGTFTGSAADLVDWFMEVHLTFAAHSHQITNQTIEIVGDRAASETYVTATLRSHPGEDGRVVDIVATGRYLDRWSKRDDVWAIDHRHHVSDVFSTYEVLAPEHPTTPDRPVSGASSRSREDPAYANFGSLLPLATAARPRPAGISRKEPA